MLKSCYNMQNRRFTRQLHRLPPCRAEEPAHRASALNGGNSAGRHHSHRTIPCAKRRKVLRKSPPILAQKRKVSCARKKQADAKK